LINNAIRKTEWSSQSLHEHMLQDW
jgi:hypothetical protein